MTGKILVRLITCLAVLCLVMGVQAAPLPDYEKIVVIHLDYHDGAYIEVAQHVRYGQPPNLNILSGNQKGVILDKDLKVMKTFYFMEPGPATGDIIEPDDGTFVPLQGYMETPAGPEMFITLPYLQNMQTFNLYDVRSDTLLGSVDLTPSFGAFCMDFPNDPDCICCNPTSGPSQTGAKTAFLYLAIFAVALAVLAILPVAVNLRKTSPDILKKQTILIVDDEPGIVELFSELLERQGYHSITALGGRECLDILTQQKDLPDLILLDIMMQPMDGWQTLEHIKSTAAIKEIPVLMLTGKQLTAAEAKQYHICIEDYIMKPLDKNQLYTAIEHSLNRKQNIYRNIVLAKKAGIAQDTYCEYAKLSKRVDVNKKLIGLLQKSYGMPEPRKHGTGDALDIIEEMIMNTRSNEDRLEHLQREIFSAFTAKGYPVPSW
jgi:two-component system OmpR family response regulator